MVMSYAVHCVMKKLSGTEHCDNMRELISCMFVDTC